jgi:hypothetical protein
MQVNVLLQLVFLCFVVCCVGLQKCSDLCIDAMDDVHRLSDPKENLSATCYAVDS